MPEKKIPLGLLNKILSCVETAHEFCVKKKKLFMPDISSRCMSTDYCVGIISGKFFSVKQEEIDHP